MSMAPRKRDGRRSRVTDGGRGTASNRNPQFFVVLALLIFAGIPFALGKYFELKCPDPFDSGSYVYSAEHVLSGARIGYEEKPSAQAGTLLVNMLGVELTGFNETGSKMLQGFFQAVALALMFLTVRRLYGTLAAVVSVTVASVYLSAPVIAKYGNVKEQFMIALMILGICSFVWYRLTGKWWWALLAGMLLVSGPLFKQTGISAIAAVGLFVLAGPILYHYAWRTVGKDILLLVAGAAVTLTPICAWYASMRTPLYYWPYSFALGPVLKLAGADLKYVADTGQPQEPPAQVEEEDKSRVEGVPPANRGLEAGAQKDSLILRLLPGYVRDSWKMLGPAERKEAFRRVLRYYRVLILPIALALGALLARLIVLWRGRRPGSKTPAEEDPGRFVLLFGLWWFFDMAFVWISPHSYEQYYLPLNASSAVLGGYFVGLYSHRFRMDRDKTRRIVLGLVGLLAMIVLSWHIFFGLAWYPYSGTPQLDAQGRPLHVKGYRQKWQEIAKDGQYPWAVVGDYIRTHSQSADTIYVWGWVPGIYVQAQRMSPTPKAFEGTMHILPPQELADRVLEIVTAFQEKPPKFIVDTRKIHFPLTRPALELWPSLWNGVRLIPSLPRDRNQWPGLMLRTLNIQPTDLIQPAGVKDNAFLRPDLPETVRKHDAAYEKLLRENAGPDEARRYEVMEPLRRYVMENYQIVGEFGGEVLFRHQ
jgi:4-amino-4-deoxy-L-arabinose transferase-like glycosyltransferase